MELLKLDHFKIFLIWAKPTIVMLLENRMEQIMNYDAFLKYLIPKFCGESLLFCKAVKGAIVVY